MNYKALSLISLLAVCISNCLSMEDKKSSTKQKIETESMEIVAQDSAHVERQMHEPYILKLPKDILIEIIKLIIMSANSNKELGQIFVIARLNKFFNKIIDEDSGQMNQMWLESLKRLNGIKNEIYQAFNLVEQKIIEEARERLRPSGMQAAVRAILSSPIEAETGSKMKSYEKSLEFITKFHLLVDMKELSKNANKLLHYGVDISNSALVIMALNNGANIDSLMNFERCTVLMKAVLSNDKEMVKLVLENGANFGEPLAYAKKWCNQEIIDLFTKYEHKMKLA